MSEDGKSVSHSGRVLNIYGKLSKLGAEKSFLTYADSDYKVGSLGIFYKKGGEVRYIIPKPPKVRQKPTVLVNLQFNEQGQQININFLVENKDGTMTRYSVFNDTDR